MCLVWKELKPVVRSQPVGQGVSDFTSRRDQGARAEGTYSDFEIHKLLRECTHLVVKAEPVFSRLACRKDEVALALLFPIHDDLVRRAHNLVVDIERASCLDLAKN